jgi:hypothetical protein
MTRSSACSITRSRNAPSSLPRPIQEHLARQLRAAYSAEQDPPAYLGDPALPVDFVEPLGRLIAVERSRDRQRASTCGFLAVQRALGCVGAGQG